MKRLSRDGIPVETLEGPEIRSVFDLLNLGRITKEAIPEILGWMSTSRGRSAEEAIKELGLERVGHEKLQEIAGRILAENQQVKQEPVERARKILLGLLMKEVRGRAEAEEAINAVKRLLPS
jgi:glutamyl-tRNA(Gln) amidotransferase subunit E